MDFEKIRKYKVAEIEKIASDVIQEHFGGSSAPPIDVDLIAEEMDVLIDIRPNLAGRKVPGICWRRSRNKYSILIDENIADNHLTFYRFTLSEEIGHIVLHKEVIDEITTEQEAAQLLAWKDYKLIDHHAKRFASAILLPPSLIAESAERIYTMLIKALDKTVRFGNVDAIEDYLASEMSKIFQVSQSAMAIRLSHTWPAGIYNRVEQSMRNESEILLPINYRQ